MTRGEQTRGAILDNALDLASVVGLGGLTIGALAARTSLSKSGLFAHFGSKEALQVEVLKAAAERFAEVVIAPARQHPRGLARLRALCRNWMNWTRNCGLSGGCVFLGAAMELDDQPGPVRDFVVEAHGRWFDTLTRTVERARRDGDLAADVDPADLAHEINGIYLDYHHASRLLGDPGAEARALRALESLIARNGA